MLRQAPENDEKTGVTFGFAGTSPQHSTWRGDMKQRSLFVLPLVVLFCGCSGNSSSDAEAVQKAFDAYKTAVLSKDGAVASAHVAQQTLDEYQKYVDWALHADRKELQSLSTINKMQVLIMKHRLPHEKWKGLTGEKAFIYAVDHDWIGKEGVISTTIGNVQVSGTRATAAAMSDQKSTPIRFHFIREDGSWKLDLVPILRTADLAIKDQIKQSGVSEDEYIFRILETLSGRKVADSIWNPIEM